MGWLGQSWGPGSPLGPHALEGRCLLTGVWSGQLGPHACPLHQVGAPIWLGCSGWGGAGGVGPSPTGPTSSLDSLPLPVMESALGRPVSELPPCPSGLEGWLCPWYTSARVHSQMTIQGVWLEIYSTHQLLRASTVRDEMLIEWDPGVSQEISQAPVFFLCMTQTLWSSWQYLLKFKL